MSHQDRKQTPAGQKMIAMLKTRDDDQLIDMFHLIDKGAHKTEEEDIVWDFIWDELETRKLITYDYTTEDFYLNGKPL